MLWFKDQSNFWDWLLQYGCTLEDHHLVVSSILVQLQHMHKDREKICYFHLQMQLQFNQRKQPCRLTEILRSYLLLGYLAESEFLRPYAFCFISCWKHNVFHIQEPKQLFQASEKALEITLHSQILFQLPNYSRAWLGGKCFFASSERYLSFTFGTSCNQGNFSHLLPKYPKNTS